MMSRNWKGMELWIVGLQRNKSFCLDSGRFGTGSLFMLESGRKLISYISTISSMLPAACYSYRVIHHFSIPKLLLSSDNCRRADLVQLTHIPP